MSICNWGACTETETRPFKDGDRCKDHEPWKLNGNPEPPSEQLVRRAPGKRNRSYAAEYRKQQDEKARRRREG